MAEQLAAAERVTAGIAAQREAFRPAASRGASLYFAGMVQVSRLGPMYQTSLAQFQRLFTRAMDVAAPALRARPGVRVANKWAR
jgi:hypothetical protein